MFRKAVDNDFSVISKMGDYEPVLNDPFINYYVCEINEKIVGFICYSIIYERVELNYIYVDVAFRKQHIGSQLMNLLIEDAIKHKCINITLEVDENNIAGLNLYKKYGFKVQALRKNYYCDSDALLMMRELV